ncbi:hypothetical protein KKE03_03565 [Patescibacteria group bacterium]|nr:hypothetical protein [Patescibacteria group bacterium]
MKKCNRCKEEKDLGQFNFKDKVKGLRQYQCKNCSRLYVRSHYEKNRKYYLLKASKRNKKIRNDIRAYIWMHLNSHPCVDCKEKDPIVLEFDHISDKIAHISTMYRNYTLGKVKLEIEKCQIRCANCHRRKTAKERGWDKKYIAPVT